jgi:hypothetical protein
MSGKFFKHLSDSESESSESEEDLVQQKPATTTAYVLFSLLLELVIEFIFVILAPIRSVMKKKRQNVWSEPPEKKDMKNC